MTTVSALPSSSTTPYDPTEKEECPYLHGAVWRASYMARDTHINLVAVTCISFLSVLPTIMLNALVILAVTTKRRLRTNSNVLLACLAGTDLSTGMVVYPVAISVDMKRILGVEPFCSLEKLYLVALIMVSFASFSHLVLISVDRYIAIRYPLRYQNIVTKQRIITGVFFAWAITVLITIQELFLAVIDGETKNYSVYQKVNNLMFLIIFLIYTVAITYIYWYILSETRRQKNRIQTEQLTQEESERFKKDNKAANTLTIILCTLIVTYLPLTIAGVVTVSSDMIEPRIKSVLLGWCTTFIMSGSLFNPIIYFWRIKKLRRAFLEILNFRQLENRTQDTGLIEMQRHQPEIQPSSCEAFSMRVARQEPVLLSIHQLQAEEIIHIEETDK
ncbi:adenosine receptor A1-like [Oculina patagonica]